MVKLWSKLHSRWYRYEQSGWLPGKWNLAGPVKSEYSPLSIGNPTPSFLLPWMYLSWLHRRRLQHSRIADHECKCKSKYLTQPDA